MERDIFLIHISQSQVSAAIFRQGDLILCEKSEGGKVEGGGDSEVSTVRSEEGGFEHVDDVDSVGNRGDGNPHRAGARFEFSRIPTDYEPGLAQAA